MLEEIKTEFDHYFIDKQRRRQGEYKRWYDNRQLHKHCFYTDGLIQGEYKEYRASGKLWIHCFYVNDIRHGEFKWFSNDASISGHHFRVHGNIVSFDKIPYPTTPEELMLFKLKYDMKLLPVETRC